MAEENGGDQVFYDRFSERIKGGNLHRSPFEEFISHNPGTPFEHMRQDMAYDGTIGGAISDLRTALSAPTEGDNYKKVAVLPQILTRAIIDYDIDNPHDRHIQNVEEALAIGLATFRGDYQTALSLLEQYEHSIGENTLTSKAFQKEDIASWMGTEPRRSYQKAIELAFHFPQKPLLFIAMGQGATSAGMDVFLRHADITERNDSDFYVVRHSELWEHTHMTRQIDSQAFHMINHQLIWPNLLTQEITQAI